MAAEGQERERSRAGERLDNRARQPVAGRVPPHPIVTVRPVQPLLLHLQPVVEEGHNLLQVLHQEPIKAAEPIKQHKTRRQLLHAGRGLRELSEKDRSFEFIEQGQGDSRGQGGAGYLSVWRY